MLGVQDFYLAGSDEVQLLHTRFVAHECLAWLGDFAIELHDYLVDETILTLLKEVAESIEKLFELMGALHQLCLHLGRQFVEEWKFKFHQIEVIQKGLVDVLLDIMIEVWLNVVRLV